MGFHALRNALIPVVTVIGLTFASLLSGAVLTETVFAWPGIGRYAVTASTRLDYPAILGVTMLTAVIYIAVNLIVDLLYGMLDPQDPRALTGPAMPAAQPIARLRPPGRSSARPRGAAGARTRRSSSASSSWESGCSWRRSPRGSRPTARRISTS